MSELRLPQRNLVVWFEIPVSDLAASARFYGEVLGLGLRLDRRAGRTRAVIQDPRFASGGALVEAPQQAGCDGVRLYLNGGPDLGRTLRRVEAAGGRVDQPPNDLGGGLGWFAVIRDPDGNAIGLHAPDAR